MNKPIRDCKAKRRKKFNSNELLLFLLLLTSYKHAKYSLIFNHSLTVQTNMPLVRQENQPEEHELHLRFEILVFHL